MSVAAADSAVIAPWREAGARLVRLLEGDIGAESSLTVLKQLNRRFGEHGYPAFMKLLLVVAESDHVRARARLADALALGLRRGDVPAGVLTSWGATSVWRAQQPLSAGMLSSNLFGVAPRRALDPLEYLTVWFSQRTHRSYLEEHTYRACLERLVDLFEASATARQHYLHKIENDLAGIEGTFTRQTSQRLAILVEGWKQGLTPDRIAGAVVQSVMPPRR